MRRIAYSLTTLLSILLSACTEEYSFDQSPDSGQKNVAETYFDNLEAIVSSAFLGDVVDESLKHNPVYEKLKTIVISDGEGNQLSFFDLPAEEKTEFFHQYAEISAESLNEKISALPSAKAYIEAQNDMVEDVLARHTVKSKAGLENVIDNPQEFFSELNTAAVKFCEEYVVEDNEITTRANLVNDPAKIISTYAGIAKRGDFIIALPKQGSPLLVLNNKAEIYPKGHVEIIISDVTNDFSVSDKFTVGTLSDGVRLHTMEQCWLCQSNVLGVEIYDYVWKKLKLSKVKRGINTEDIASYAEMFTYTPHTTDAEALISKWIAPKHFTDATLLWWTMKDLYDIELGSWILTSISAIDIYNNEYTYLKSTVN